jgi:hypothetical protein
MAAALEAHHHKDYPSLAQLPLGTPEGETRNSLRCFYLYR